MKTIVIFRLLLVVSLLFALAQTQARVYRVNNILATSAGQFLYASLTEALAVASTGDTIMVEGSQTAYSEYVDITKRLVIFGPGYYLSENAPKQANSLEATFPNSIRFQLGSQGSTIAGLAIGYLYINTDNIRVTRCRVYGNLYLGSGRNISNPIITQNWLSDISDSYAVGNATLSNNIIVNSINLNTSGTYFSQFSTVSNNIFQGQTIQMRTSVFQNNILTYNGGAPTATIVSGTIRNNLAAAGQLGTANGNKDYDPAANNLFVGLTGSNNSPDGQYRLKADSPFIDDGVGGAQPGVFGGMLPYVVSGMPPIPAIYEMSTSGNGSAQSGLPITIKIKSY